MNTVVLPSTLSIGFSALASHFASQSRNNVAHGFRRRARQDSGAFPVCSKNSNSAEPLPKSSISPAKALSVSVLRTPSVNLAHSCLLWSRLLTRVGTAIYATNVTTGTKRQALEPPSSRPNSWALSLALSSMNKPETRSISKVVCRAGGT